MTLSHELGSERVSEQVNKRGNRRANGPVLYASISYNFGPQCIHPFMKFATGAETLSNLETFDGNFDTDSAANTALGTLEVGWGKACTYHLLSLYVSIFCFDFVTVHLYTHLNVIVH